MSRHVISYSYIARISGFLSAGAGSDLPGNFGLQDQLMALRWVQRNIIKFRGDPDNVTIFGSSAGGASVGLLMMSPKSKGIILYFFV
jgi:carboxylesterase type B